MTGPFEIDALFPDADGVPLDYRGYDGVRVIAPDGTAIGQIDLPEICSNLCFGGAKGNRLFMTGSQSLYSLYVEATAPK